tara:strand:- start:365 stop:559 length:195 start_codon:yes stop_codon:yes gene_type:complete
MSNEDLKTEIDDLKIANNKLELEYKLLKQSNEALWQAVTTLAKIVLPEMADRLDDWQKKHLNKE